MRTFLLVFCVCLRAFPQVNLRVTFDHPPMPEVVGGMKAQVNNAFVEPSLTFSWFADDYSRSFRGELLLIHFYGLCAGAGYEPYADGLALGWAHKDPDGEIIPSIGINCDLVRGTIRQHSDTTFAKALGYVVAHEIYHVLANTERHGRGIMKARFCAHDLLDNHLRFSDKEMALLREMRTELLIAAGYDCSSGCTQHQLREVSQVR